MGNSSSANSLPSQIVREELDNSFLRIFEALAKSALAGASACTGAIFELTASYMDQPAFDSLRKFHDLYFSESDIDKQKDAVNSSVDDMVSILQSRLEAGETIDDPLDVNEDEEMKIQRLSLSAVQKQMEGLVVLDSGLKEKVLPALASMQFEDAIRQRLAHVVEAWWQIGGVLHKNLTAAELEEMARALAKSLSSVDETKSFYELVLNEKAPEGQDQRSIFIEF